MELKRHDPALLLSRCNLFTDLFMAISTNSIIHYTESYDALTGILSEGFRVKYCLERLQINGTLSVAAHPMVSFCDIPLSDSVRHFSAYGEYGIGLSKSWAVKNRVNPVIYIDHNSLFAGSIERLIVERRKHDTNLTKDQGEDILRIKSYAKNYSGRLKRGGVDNDDYKFYDEREWRLVPSSDIIGDLAFSVRGDAYIKRKDYYNEKISHCRIKFSAVDISYVIVRETTEIPRIIEFIRSSYSNKCTASELDLLFSKICSTQQILDDY